MAKLKCLIVMILLLASCAMCQAPPRQYSNKEKSDICTAVAIVTAETIVLAKFPPKKLKAAYYAIPRPPATPEKFRAYLEKWVPCLVVLYEIGMEQPDFKQTDYYIRCGIELGMNRLLNSCSKKRKKAGQWVTL